MLASVFADLESLPLAIDLKQPFCLQELWQRTWQPTIDIEISAISKGHAFGIENFNDRF